MDKKVTVCIPTLNEVDSIGDVVKGVVDEGYDPLVIDGGSEDETRSVARENGAEVIIQNIDGGKGAAIKQIIENENTEDIIVFIDGDKTYETQHIDRIISPIVDMGCDHVIGNRFADMKEGSMKSTHKIGNKLVNMSFRFLYGQNVADLLTGFRAIRMDSFQDINIKSMGFGIETELTAYSVRNQHKISVVETSYYEREGHSKLNGFSDGIAIANRLIRCRFE